MNQAIMLSNLADQLLLISERNKHCHELQLLHVMFRVPALEGGVLFSP